MNSLILLLDKEKDHLVTRNTSTFNYVCIRVKTEKYSHHNKDKNKNLDYVPLIIFFPKSGCITMTKKVKEYEDSTLSNVTGFLNVRD